MRGTNVGRGGEGRPPYGIAELKENFGHAGAVPNNDDIPTALQAIQSGPNGVHPEGTK